MSIGAYVPHRRADRSDPLFAPAKVKSREEAWAHLEHAVTAPSGEVEATVRELALAWEWTPSAVDRWLRQLEEAGHVERRRLGDSPRAGQVIVIVHLRDFWSGNAGGGERNKTGTIGGTKKVSSGATSRLSAETISETKTRQSGGSHLFPGEKQENSPPIGGETRAHVREGGPDLFAQAPDAKPPAGAAAATKAGRKASARASPKVPLPEDWHPPNELREVAVREGRDFDRELVKFRNSAVANGRRYTAGKGWNAAFHNWLTSPYGRDERPVNLGGGYGGTRGSHGGGGAAAPAGAEGGVWRGGYRRTIGT